MTAIRFMWRRPRASPSTARRVATCVVPTYSATGSYTITAQYLGSTNYAPSAVSAPITQVVNAAPFMTPTVTALGSSANPSAVNATVTYTATVTAGGSAVNAAGTVAFTDAGTTISGCGAVALNSSGVATCVIPTNTYSSVGTHAIVANYGTGTYATSSASITQIVITATGLATSTALTSSPDPYTTCTGCTNGSGYSITLTVHVTSGGTAVNGVGTVAFTFKGVSISSCTAQPVNSSGVATCTSNLVPNGAGAYPVVATYSGTGTYGGSSATILQIFGNSGSTPPQTSIATGTTISSSANPSLVNATVTYTATVTGGPTTTGTVAFTDNGTTTARLWERKHCSGGMATCRDSGEHLHDRGAPTPSSPPTRAP